MSYEGVRVDDASAQVSDVTANVTANVAVNATSDVEPASEFAKRLAVLDVTDFSVDYGVGDATVRAVNEVSFSLERSRVLGVAGESGSGKSTLVYALTRLLRAPGVISGGEAVLHVSREDGRVEALNMTTASEAALRSVRWSHVSIVLQSALNALNPVLRVRHEFDEVLKTHRREMSRAQRRARSAQLMALVGLNEDRLARYPHELSGGQRQRVMIALALALEPELVIMDEPTTALDVVTQREIINELNSLRSQFGFAMIFITHDLSLLVELADEIVVMYAGRIVERATAADLYATPMHPYTLGLLNSFPPLSGERRELTGIPGSPPDLSDLPSGCTFHPRCPYAMARCERETPELVVDERRGRSVACWLHVDHDSPPTPVELSGRRLRATVPVGAREEAQ